VYNSIVNFILPTQPIPARYPSWANCSDQKVFYRNYFIKTSYSLFNI